MSILEHLPEDSRVTIIRIRSLGDCVLTTPAIGLLNKTRPDLKISVAVEDRFRPVFEHNPAVVNLAGCSWKEVRAWNPSLILNLHGGTRSQCITALSGARWRAGFAHHNVTLAYNIKIPRAQRVLGVNRTVHTAEHLASAVFALGVPFQPIPRASLSAMMPSPFTGRYGVIHPFASAPDKQWPAERFCELARYLELWNIKPVFLAGPEEDTTPYRAHEVVQASLSNAMSVISRATVFVGNDSGPAHLAAGFGIPTVVLFGNSNPAIWGPWETESEIVVAPDGLSNISVSRVIAALERLRILEEAHA